MSEPVHIYKYRDRRFKGKTLCGLVGVIRNDFLSYERFNHEQHELFGITSIRHATCTDCMVREIDTMENELKMAKVRLEGLKVVNGK